MWDWGSFLFGVAAVGVPWLMSWAWKPAPAVLPQAKTEEPFNPTPYVDPATGLEIDGVAAGIGEISALMAGGWRLQPLCTGEGVLISQPVEKPTLLYNPGKIIHLLVPSKMYREFKALH